jgi:hypothetical protein
MDITDIPGQIAKAFKYSLRSSSTFLLSMVTALLAFGIGYDLLYGFWYIRRHNVKDPAYGTPYFIGLLVVSVLFPLTIGLIALFRARAQARPFKVARIGISIAPFEVFSVSPETLGTANVLQALDIVSTQFFRVVKNTLSEYEAAKELEFRFLPAFTKITSKQEAVQYCTKLRAAMVVWGSITQRSRQPLEIRLNLQAASESYSFSHLSIEQFPMLPLQFFIFFEAAKAALKNGDMARARQFFVQARPLGEELDKQKETKFVSSVDEWLAKLPMSPEARNAVSSSD